VIAVLVSTGHYQSPITSSEVHGDVIVNYGNIEQQQLGEKAIEYKSPPKSSIFRGQSTKIFVGRIQDIDTIRDYFLESNLPVSITGEGGIGKSELRMIICYALYIHIKSP
jgi:hypothetical protein